MSEPNSEFINTTEHEAVMNDFDQGHNILITGPAGTGKSTLLRKILEKVSRYALVCATTGSASLQLPNGQTLHNALRMSCEYYSVTDLQRRYADLLKRYQHLPLDMKQTHWITAIREAHFMIVDECSMLSAWMMEAIDVILCEIRQRHDLPWGGLRVVFVGDFCQLPPVYNRKDSNVPPTQGHFAFQSAVWSALNVRVHYLTRIFRQVNAEFQDLLQHVRNSLAFKPTHIRMLDDMKQKTASENAIYINGNKARVTAYNQQKMNELTTSMSRTYSFPLSKISVETIVYDQLMKNVQESLHLTDQDKTQTFKLNMRVMITRNIRLQGETLAINGDTGTVVAFHTPMGGRDSYPIVYVDRYKHLGPPQPDQYAGFSISEQPIWKIGAMLMVVPCEWKRVTLNVNQAEQTMEETVLANISAFPLIPAWAITAHKAQGATIANIDVRIDASDMDWQIGTFYVALSRAKSPEQVSLIHFTGFRQHRLPPAFYQGQYQMALPKTYVVPVVSEQERLDQLFGPVESKTVPDTSAKFHLSPDRSLNSLKEEFDTHVSPLLSALWEKYQHTKAPKRKHSVLLNVLEEWIQDKKSKSK